MLKMPFTRWMNKRKRQIVSRVLFSRKLRNVCHLSSIDVTVNIKRPTHPYFRRSKTSNFFRIYMVFQHVRFTSICCHQQTGELLPHHFTLIRQRRTVYFLLHFLLYWHSCQYTFPLGSTLLCAARTFLSPSYDEQRQTDLPLYKIRDYSLINDDWMSLLFSRNTIM